VRLLVIAFCLALGAPVRADPIDDYVRSQLGPRHLPGISVAVVRNGAIVKAEGYGLSNLELRAPATADTVYEIGSISKQITAEAVMLLVEDGRLSLDDRLSKYLDRTPPAWADITIRHVLTHTAGLADFDTGDIGFSYRREYTIAEFVDLVAARPLAFKPGERWNYTNSFVLLGPVIARASGLSYEDFVTRRIFKPLDLASARFKQAGDIVANRADGYVWREGAWRRGEPLRPAIIAPNGGIMMSVADFAKWDIALTQGRLLTAASWAAMREPARLNDGRTIGHGLAWFMDTFNGRRFMAHWGSTVAGYSAVVRRYVDAGVTVILLANLDDGGVAVDAMSKRITDMYVPGAAIQGLSPQPAPDSSQLTASLAALARGQDDAHVVAGLGARINADNRSRLAAATAIGARLEYLGGEAIGASHFNLDPTVVRVEWYRATASDGRRIYLTVYFQRDRTLARILTED
jgi:CubicO group peptidase (beta-lactamase class C family)